MIADFSKKQNRLQKDILLKALAFVCLAVFVVFAFANIKLYLRKKELSAQIKNYSLQLKKIEDSNKKLEEMIANSGNPDYIEKVAREEANMQKPGEKAVSFVMPEEGQQASLVKKNFWGYFSAGLSNFWQQIKSVFK